MAGQSVVLYHLLKSIPPEDYCLITQKNLYLYHYLEHCLPRLPARYFHLSPDYQVIRQMMKVLAGFPIRPLLTLILKNRVRQVKKILTKEKVEVVVVCTGDLFDPPAVFLASRELGIPFILYGFDYYSHQWTTPVTKSFAEEYEREILSGAKHIIVPNECMAEEYFRRYGIRPVVIHNPFDREEYEKNSSPQKNGIVSRMEISDNVSIVYTGAIYDAHFTAFQNLIAAIPKTGIPQLRLHIYTPQSAGMLQSHGISGPVVIHKSRQNHEMPDIQMSADILFLPLAFNSPYPEIIRTSSPGKIGEYLAAKKPVLVHAPAESFIAWFFLKNHCGEVVSECDPDMLALSIVRLVRDEPYRQELIHNAYRLAMDDFNAISARTRILNLIEND
jgi:glycosyltransferase involved in cell wall biosynthesis